MKKINKPSKKTNFSENFGKVLVDLGKLIFGSLILGGLLRGELPQIILITGGMVVSTIYISTGLILTSKGED